MTHPTEAELDKLDAQCVEFIQSREAMIEAAYWEWRSPLRHTPGLDHAFRAGWTAALAHRPALAGDGWEWVLTPTAETIERNKVDVREALAHRPASTDLREAVAAETTHGRVTWHSSDEDGGPDVGLSLGLGDGKSLYMGELAKATLAAGGINVEETGDGRWFALMGASIEPVALVVNADGARALFEELAALASLRCLATAGAELARMREALEYSEKALNRAWWDAESTRIFYPEDFSRRTTEWRRIRDNEKFFADAMRRVREALGAKP